MKENLKKRIPALLGAFLICAVSPLYVLAEDAVDGACEENERPSLTMRHDFSTSYLAKDESALPASYDLRDYGLVTSVKDQDETGTCWAHAALASAESNMLKTGLAGTVMKKYGLSGEIDLSERHLVWFGNCRYSSDPDDPLYHKGNNKGQAGYEDEGANPYTAVSTLGRWVGAQTESSFPDITNKTGISESERYTSVAHLQNASLFKPSETEDIKNCLMENGAMYINFYSSTETAAYYNKNTASYYYYVDPEDENYHKANHAVTLIGWDDTYSKDNFSTTPPGNGAWLCKNSYNTSFGNNGYFYLSYYDTSITNFASFRMESADNYDNIYQYDAEYDDAVYRTNAPGTAAANVFTADKNENITAVSLWTDYLNTEYTIFIYADVDNSDEDPTNGVLISTQSGVFDKRGYYTVNLETPVFAKKGTKFSVVAAYHKTGDGIGAIPYDESNPTAGVSYTASYDPNTGLITNWAEKTDLNPCIKAFTKDGIIINEENFPDNVLRGFVSNTARDTDGNKILSNEEINNITYLKATGSRKNIPWALEGIEHLTAIESLTAVDCSVVALDLSNNTLLLRDGFTCTGCGLDIDEVSEEYLATLPIDTSKILSISGAEIQNGRIIPTDTTIAYTYDCGNRLTADFTIVAKTLVTEPELMLGDVDGSGKIDILDVITINRAILGKESLSSSQLKAADLNGNSKPDSADSLTLMKYIVGLITDLTA